MNTDAISEEIIALIERAKADAYERGRADAKREMLDMLSHGVARPSSPYEATTNAEESFVESNANRKRAPRGLVGKLILKTLGSQSYSSVGLSPLEIEQSAETEDERMIKVSSIRGELKRRKDVWYREIGGKWLLTDQGRREAETNDLIPQRQGSLVSVHHQPYAEGREGVPGGGP